MSFLRMFGPREPHEWGLEALRQPWPADRPSILAAIRGALARGDSQSELPDEEYVAIEPGIRFMPGLHDRTMLIHEDERGLEGQVQHIMDSLYRLASSGRQADLDRFYTEVVEHRMADALPIVADILRDGTRLPRERLVAVGRYLMNGAPDRDAVKLGAVLVGAAGAAADSSLLVELAGHEEFTDVALEALTGTEDEIREAAFDIARRTSGWGRVAAVGRLDGSNDPEIKDWLLRNGHSLHVYEVTEICVVCARTGGLAEALARDTLDAELLLALAGLFGDLTWTTDRPDHDPHMNDYERGIEAARHLVRHLDMAEPEIRLWERVVLLRNALDPDLDLSWPLKEVDALRSGLDRFLARPEWPTVAERALETAMDPHTCSAAARAAEHFGIPMFDHAWRWLHEDYELGGWVRAMEEVTAERIDEVLEYALATFRLPDIPQEPTGELYYHGGKFYRALSDLNCVVGRLNRFPGKGWELIRIGLRTPGSRDREDAVRALEAWAPESLTDEQRAYLAWAAAGEPDVELRRRMQALADA